MSLNEQPASTSVNARVMATLQKARSKIERLEQAQREPIAIVGMACRLPGGATTPEKFWELLDAGEDAVTSVPAARWDKDAFYDADQDAAGKIYTREGGFLQEPIDQFDPQFFGISPREAHSIDPQQRMLLEVSWEALERAGYIQPRLNNASVGVFVGISHSDYGQMQLSAAPSDISAYSGTGNLFNFASGRLSYLLGIQGPSMALDTACSSSLVAIHLACQSLRSSECDMAVAGGINLMLTPETTVFLSRIHALAPDGRCKTFDASANGYGRGEGCGVIVLKRLSQAVADGDNIVGLIRGSAVNHDGASSGLTVPNGPAQQAVIRRALDNANIDPLDVGYVEAHGTGTSLGDPIELGALDAVYNRNRAQDDPLVVGSVKTNIGHLEAAAGVAGIIKLVLSLENQCIPAHLHFETPSPHINWDELAVQIPTESRAWPSVKGQPRSASISSFGISGTNAHVVVQEAPERPSVTLSEQPQVLLLSAETPDALRSIAEQYQAFCAANSAANWQEVCFTANTGRKQCRYRLAIVAQNLADAAQQLEQWLSAASPSSLAAGSDTAEPSIAFLFSGQGSQYPGMGKALYKQQPVFQQAIDQCAALLADRLPIPLTDLLFTSTSDLLNNTQFTQPALFALEYALSQYWLALGVQPDALIGHSVGEYVAACLAGVFSLEDGLKLISERGRLMQALPDNGAMVALRASAEDAIALLEGHLEDYEVHVSLAAVNGPTSVVLAGDKVHIAAISAEAERAGIKVKPLAVSHAFHSPLMKPMLDSFAQVAYSISYQAPHSTLISNVTGAQIGTEIACAQYWLDHVLAPVQFAKGVGTLMALNCDVLVEIGPQATLLGMAQLCDTKADERLWLASLRPKQTMQTQLSLAQLAAKGSNINWPQTLPESQQRRLVLPTYPFQRQTYWRQPRRATTVAGHPLLGSSIALPMSNETRFGVEWTADSPGYFEHHRLFDTIIAPAASHVAMCLLAAQQRWPDRPMAYQNLSFPQAITLADEEARAVQLIMRPMEDGEQQSQWQLVSETENDSWTLHAMGELGPLSDSTTPLPKTLETLQAQFSNEVTGQAFSEGLWDAGYTLGSAFNWIETLWTDNGSAVCRMAQPQLPDRAADYILYPGLIDSCFQLLTSCWHVDIGTMADGEFIFIPFGLESLHVIRQPSVGEQLWCYAKARPAGDDASLVGGDIWLLDDEGQIVAMFTDFRGRKAPRDVLLGQNQTGLASSLYEVSWMSEALTSPSLPDGDWLVVGESGGVGEQLAAQLRADGRRCALVATRTTHQHPDTLQFDVADVEQLGTWIDQMLQKRWRGVIHLAALDSAENLPFDSQSLTAGSLLTILQALARSGSFLPVWSVTQGVMAGLAPSQATTIGMCNVARLEYPDWQLSSIDLPTEMAPQQQAKLLLSELSSTTLGEQIAYDGQVRQVARLLRQNNLAEQSIAQVDAETSVLITGGLGALGLTMADQLIAAGAGHLVLTSRRGEPSDEARVAIDAWQNAGVTVVVAKADVTNLADMQQLIAQFGSDWPQLGGVIHAAGVIQDGLLENQTWASFETVLAPKVLGSYHLHQLTQACDLRFFIMCSSMSTVLGSLGQLNYAAANAYLDALAQQRQSQGLPALSINWGPWAGSGMAAGLQEQLAARGIKMFSAEKGGELFANLVNHSASAIGAIDVEWNAYCKQFASGNIPSLLHRLRPVVTAPSSKRDMMAELLQLPSNEQRVAQLSEFIVSCLAQVLSLSPSSISTTQVFSEFGLDSLMSLEVRNRIQQGLNKSLPATLAFDYPTIEKITHFLAGELDLLEQADADEFIDDEVDFDIFGSDLDDLFEEVADLSNEQIQQMMMQR